ncbi:hypothetical protein ACFWIA_34270 [Streptomyces sp. NPDC127068]|uniref:hypothetical protein n=1 Tax=Streptomyces sp. NPDC127068 TaxID=3347127 RepID=UPI0036622486
MTWPFPDGRNENNAVPTPATNPPPARRAADSGRDFELLLQQAESLMDDLGRDLRRRLVLRALQCTVALSPLVTLLATSAPLVVMAALVAAAALVLLLEVYGARPAARRRDQQLAEVAERVDELREVLVHLSKREHWSQNRVQDARGRLARFAVEERGRFW